MALQKNVGGTDRTARLVGGVALAAVAAGAYWTGSATLAAVAAVVGLVLLVTATTRFCGLYALLGVDTCSRNRS